MAPSHAFSLTADSASHGLPRCKGEETRRAFPGHSKGHGTYHDREGGFHAGGGGRESVARHPAQAGLGLRLHPVVLLPLPMEEAPIRKLAAAAALPLALHPLPCRGIQQKVGSGTVCHAER